MGAQIIYAFIQSTALWISTLTWLESTLPTGYLKEPWLPVLDLLVQTSNSVHSQTRDVQTTSPSFLLVGASVLGSMAVKIPSQLPAAEAVGQAVVEQAAVEQVVAEQVAAEQVAVGQVVEAQAEVEEAAALLVQDQAPSSYRPLSGPARTQYSNVYRPASSCFHPTSYPAPPPSISHSILLLLTWPG